MRKKRPHVKLTKKEEAELARIDVESLIAHDKRINFLRKVANKSGRIAKELKDLKSRSGKPFIEAKSDFLYPYRRATIKESSESAYFCGTDMFPGCGWVIGIPASESYDEIGFLCGSAGTRYYCEICGDLVGEHAHTFS